MRLHSSNSYYGESFIHSVKIQSLLVPETVVGSRDTVIEKSSKKLALMAFMF